MDGMFTKWLFLSSNKTDGPPRQNQKLQTVNDKRVVSVWYTHNKYKRTENLCIFFCCVPGIIERNCSLSAQIFWTLLRICQILLSLQNHGICKTSISSSDTTLKCTFFSSKLHSRSVYRRTCSQIWIGIESLLDEGLSHPKPSWTEGTWKTDWISYF